MDKNGPASHNRYNGIWAKKTNADQPPQSRGRRRILSVVAAVAASVLFFAPGGFLPLPNDTVMVALAETEIAEETVPEASSPEAVRELVGYVDRAEKLLAEADGTITGLQEEETRAKRYQKQAEVLEELVSALSKLQKQANLVGGIDGKLKRAGKEYFNMACDSQKTFLEAWRFYADFFDLSDHILDHRPKAGDYADTAEYYNALYTWYETAKEGYAAVGSCPSYLKPQWKRYGEILDLNGNIRSKLYDSLRYDDYLRYVSAMNMSERYDKLRALQYNRFLASTDGGNELILSRRKLASGLAEEIYAYAGMEEEDRSEYEFENIHTGEISFGYDAVDTIYPSLYNSYDAFLIIKTGCISGSKKILIETEIEGFTQSYRETFTIDSAYTTINIKPPALPGDLHLSSAKNAQIRVSISEPDGTRIEEKSFPVLLKSKYDFDWYSDEYGISTKDNILCFLSPESASIASLKRQAIDEIFRITGGRVNFFAGYQETGLKTHYAGTYVQAAGIMRALYETGVRYNMATFSISNSNQHILLPEDVLQQKGGLCIETSLVVASALQSAGMHAFIVLPPGHAQVAVEVWNGSGDMIGTGEYFLIETTALSDNWENAFQEGCLALEDYKGVSGVITYYNQDSWKKYLSQKGTYLIDCDDSRVLGLTPFAN